MSIERSAPDVGYVSPAVFAQLNVSQTVRANGTVWFSGIVAATGDGEAVAPGDPAEQVQFVLGILERLLQKERMSFANLVAVTVYTPALEAVLAQLGQFTAAFAGHPPAFQVIGISNLPSPDYLLEVVAVAAET
jgi:enamine deaminase RidA (YjgF/YER057c/UK114 family)